MHGPLSDIAFWWRIGCSCMSAQGGSLHGRFFRSLLALHPTIQGMRSMIRTIVARLARNACRADFASFSLPMWGFP